MATKRRKKSFWKHLRNALFPHKDNGRHPYLFGIEAIAAILFLVLMVEGASFLQINNIIRSVTEFGAVLPAVVIDLTNQQRSSDNLSTLTSNPLLTEAAQAVANDMAAKGYFAHVSPEGKTPWDWLNQVGYAYQYAGENLAINFDDSQQLMNAWMESPTHKANILGPDFTEIGIGMAEGTYEGQQVLFVVQFFGSPRAVAAKPVKPTTPTAPVPTPAQTNVSIPSTPTVAAAETPAVTTNPTDTETAAHIPVTQAAQAPSEPQPPLSFWTRVASSPRTYAIYALIGITAFIVLIFILNLVPFSGPFPHTKALMNGFAFVVIMIAVVTANQTLFSNNVSLPTDTQAASVVFSIQH